MLDASPIEKVAIVLTSCLGVGEAANVAACIAAGLAASLPAWAGRPLVDADGVASCAASHLPIVMLAADEARMASLLERWAAGLPMKDAAASLFPAYAQSMHEATAYWQRHAEVSHRAERLLGIGFSGRKKWVNSLVGSLPLLR